MTRQILHLLILTSALSCNTGRPENQGELNIANTNKTEAKASNNIRFDFSAKRINTFKETIEIEASLFNDNIDTAYFLSSSCDGEQYSLRYDTTKFILTPFINCNANFPSLMKIAPKGQHNFRAHFRCSNDETKIKLGFDFYKVEKSFDITKIHLADRQNQEQNVIWTDTKMIK